MRWREFHRAPSSSGVACLAGGCGSAVRIGLEDALLAQWRLLLHIELEDSGIPPCDRGPSGARPVQAGLDRSPGRGNTFGATVEYAVVAEGRTPGRGTGSALGVSERIQSRIEHVEPTGDRPVSNNGYDKKVAGASCRHIDEPHRFRPVASQFLVGSFEEFGRRAAAERLKPQPAGRVDVPAGSVPGRRTCRIGQDDDRELEPLGFVDGHHPDALRAFLDNRRLVRLTALGIRLDLFDEGSE